MRILPVVAAVTAAFLVVACSSPMIVLSKREKETLHEISKWPEFPEYWKPKTRAKLERLGLVANVSETWCSANYQLTDKGKVLLQQLVESGALK